MLLYPMFDATQAIRSCGADMMIYDFASNPVVGLRQDIVKSRMRPENVHYSLPPRKILKPKCYPLARTLRCCILAPWHFLATKILSLAEQRY
jgi:hypothetical protein